MILDTSLPPTSLSDVPQLAREAEAMGFNAVWSTETQHDPFLPGALVFEHTDRLVFGTAIAIAFARSPANLAYTAWDLAQASKGRFILGLGTQVKAHIERRFGMPWPESPVLKLGEQIAAIRAFWRCWQTGEPLKFRGEHYKLSLMTPFFNPGPIECPEIPIFIAGVNTGLAHLAGEVADGFHVHPLHTPRYLTEVILPAIEKGMGKREQRQVKFQVSVIAITACTMEERLFARQHIAFYASTPSYRSVMTLHDWQETAEQLSQLASRGKWDDMPGLINEEMLATFATLAAPGDLASALRQRYQGLADRISLYTPFIPGECDDFWRSLIKDLSDAGLQ